MFKINSVLPFLFAFFLFQNAIRFVFQDINYLNDFILHLPDLFSFFSQNFVYNVLPFILKIFH